MSTVTLQSSQDLTAPLVNENAIIITAVGEPSSENQSSVYMYENGYSYVYNNELQVFFPSWSGGVDCQSVAEQDGEVRPNTPFFYYLNGEELIINGQIWNEDLAQSTTNANISSNTSIIAQDVAGSASIEKCPNCGLYTYNGTTCTNCGYSTLSTPTKVFKLDKGNFTISGSSYSYSGVGRAIYQTGGTLTLTGDTFNGFSTRNGELGGVIYQEGGTLNLGANNTITTTSDYAIYAGGTLNLTGDSAISAGVAGIYLTADNYININANVSKTYTIYKENLTRYEDTTANTSIIAYSTNATYLQNFLNNLTVANLDGNSLEIEGNYIVVAEKGEKLTLNLDGERTKKVLIQENTALSDLIPVLDSSWVSNDEKTCGWFYDNNCSEVVDLSQIPTASMTLYTKTASDASNFTFTIADDSSCYYIKANSTSISGNIVFPNAYKADGDETSLPVQIYSASLYSSGAFYNCTSITSVTLNANCTSIPAYAFYNCTKLTSITIPDSVTSIAGYALGYCTGLTSIYIPSSVTTISASSYYNSPFYNCSSSLLIFCGASSKPSGWSSYWNYYSYSYYEDGTNVFWGVTREEYESTYANASFAGTGSAVSELAGLSENSSVALSENIACRTNVLHAQNVASVSASGASYDVSVAQIEEPTDTVTAYVEQEKKYLMGAVLNKKLFGNDDKIE